MKLVFVHQILIGAAIFLAVIFGLRALVLGARGGGGVEVGLGVVSFAVAVALGLYLRRFRAKLAEQARPRG